MEAKYKKENNSKGPTTRKWLIHINQLNRVSYTRKQRSEQETGT